MPSTIHMYRPLFPLLVILGILALSHKALSQAQVLSLPTAQILRSDTIRATITPASTYKPAPRANIIEAGIIPFGAGPFGWSNGVRYRRVRSKRFVVRYEGNLAMSTSTVVERLSERSQLALETSRVDLALGIAFEWHRPGTHRLSPFAGIGFRYITASNETRVAEFDGPRPTQGDFTRVFRNDQGFFGGTTYFFMGADAYVIEHFYIGTELSFGISATAPHQARIVAPSPYSEYRSTARTGVFIAPLSLPQLRVGFVF